MKTIGLLGGMSFESSAEYYRIIHTTIRERVDGLNPVQSVLFTVDHAAIHELQHVGNWDACADILIDGAKKLQGAGADCLLICTNTMHKVAPQIQAAIDIPILHIADATGREIHGQGLTALGLLGTKFTMKEAFYSEHLATHFHIKTIVPTDTEQEYIHTMIFDELCEGIISDATRNQFVTIIEALHARGAQGIILGCTEIPLLVQSHHVSIPLLNTMHIHATAAVDFALDMS